MRSTSGSLNAFSAVGVAPASRACAAAGTPWRSAVSARSTRQGLGAMPPTAKRVAPPSRGITAATETSAKA